jgi:beta-lactamase class A
MSITSRFAALLLALIPLHGAAQSINSIRQEILQIVSSKNAIVGVSILGDDGKDSLSVNGAMHFPLQSVFKFPIALAVLSEVDKGKLSIDTPVLIEKKDLLPGLYSPIRDRFPDGTTLGLKAILGYAVSQSDNVACDVLLRMIGGPAVVEKFMRDNDIPDISIKINEETQQANWEMQFQNWATPKAATELLTKFYYNRPTLLSAKSYDLLWQMMKETTTGPMRIKGLLPPNTIVAHKTGSSGANKDGLTAAVNDIGIVFLPSGKYFFISVFVTNSRENADTNEKIIADISKATWDFFSNKK